MLPIPTPSFTQLWNAELNGDEEWCCAVSARTWGPSAPTMGTAGACPALGPLVFSLLGTFLHAAKTNSRLFMGLLCLTHRPEMWSYCSSHSHRAGLQLWGLHSQCSRKPRHLHCSFTEQTFCLGRGRSRESENKTHKLCFSALQPALTFMCSPSLKHHYSHLPQGTGITSKLSGIRRNSFFPDYLKAFLMLWWEFGFQMQSCCSSGATGTALRSHRLGWCVLRFWAGTDCMFWPCSFQCYCEKACLELYFPM